MTNIQVGDSAPDFTLADQDGNQVHLADQLGKSKVVLIFYPGDDTPGCTRQLCAVRDDAALYQQAGAKVFGVNQAGSASHGKFISKYQLTTPLLVDSGLQVAHEYDAVNATGSHINRTVIGINEAGKVVYYIHGLPSTEEIIAAIK
jgi:peroxiredoxin Q/BCP